MVLNLYNNKANSLKCIGLPVTKFVPYLTKKIFLLTKLTTHLEGFFCDST